jgi:dsDNA-specific endonuclease/ATPase MutS2
MPVDGILDLHAFRPEEVLDVVQEYLEACRERGIFQIRIIHGKGKGVQRAAVRSLLEKHSLVVSFSDAPASAGGWGATVVDLLAEDK